MLGRVLRGLGDRLPLASDAEVTVECNPTSVTEGHFRSLLAVGVNRVSIGVQATDDQRLGFLGRLHDGASGLGALGAAHRARVPRVSADLIFGVAGQPPDAAVRDVRRVLDAGVSHISCYALTIEENTRFGALKRSGRLPLLADALVARSFVAVENALLEGGFLHYEISNYAMAGEESQHNLGYWLGRDYLGLGTGAYGTVTLQAGRLRYRNFLSPDRYMSAMESSADGTCDPFSTLVSEREELAPQTSLSEAIMLGLRLDRGISPDELADQTGATFWTTERRTAVDRLCQQEKLREKDGRLFIPREHWLFADGIVSQLL
jgi:oxygen-independent coproporphyrinogen-3 oxidase